MAFIFESRLGVSRFRIGLKSIFLITAFCCALTAWYAHLRNESEKATRFVNDLRALNARIETKQTGPRLLSEVFGSENISPGNVVTEVDFSGSHLIFGHQRVPSASDPDALIELPINPAVDLAPIGQFKTLTKLNCRGVVLKPGSLVAIARCTDLEELDLSNVRYLAVFSHDELQLLPLLKQLKVLRVLNHEAEGNEIMEAVAQMPQLRELRLSARSIEDSAAIGLKNLRSLQVLEFSESAITDATLPYIGMMADLTELDLSWSQISDNGTMHLANCRKLQILNLGATQLTDKCLVHLGELSELRQLELPLSVEIDNRGLRCIGRLTRLEVLQARLRPTVSDEGIAQLSNLKSLIRLDLSNTQVTDQSLQTIEGLKGLQSLVLDGTAVTDKNIRRLDSLPWLNLLSLRNCRVSDVEVRRLLAAHPQLHVIRE